MRYNHRFIRALSVVSILGLTGCVASYHELQNATPASPGYTKVLSNAYLAQANQENAQMDYRILDFLSEKGLRAAGGETVFADSIANWDVPAATIQELSEARQLLRDAYNDNLHNIYPELVAQAQVAFDTWISSVYYADTDDAAVAREAMINAIAQLATNVVTVGTPTASTPFMVALAQPMPSAAAPVSSPAAAAPVSSSSTMGSVAKAMASDPMAGGNQAMTAAGMAETVYQDYAPQQGAMSKDEAFIFFDNGSAQLTEADMSIIGQMANAIQQAGYTSASVLGYTSPQGTPMGNLRMAQKRSDAVKAALVKALGDYASKITITAAGQGAKAPAMLPPEYQRAVLIKIL